jgi:hypothetical protein
MAHSATTINENGICWQYAVARRVVQRSSTLLALESPWMSFTRDALWHNGMSPPRQGAYSQCDDSVRIVDPEAIARAPCWQLIRSPHLSRSNTGHVCCNVQYLCAAVGCHLRRKVVEFAVSHEIHNPKVGGSNPPPATNEIINLGPADQWQALRVCGQCAGF